MQKATSPIQSHRSLPKTHQRLELIVVNDGSEDQTRSIVQSFKDARLRLIDQCQSGAAAARNAAFGVSSGRFVLFLDADDLICPVHISALLERIQSEPFCVALSKWDRFFQRPNEASFPDRPTEKDMSGPDWLELDWLHARPMTQSAMLLLPRDLLTRHGCWDERLSLNDDFEFFARMISNCSGVKFAPEARLYYRSGIAGSLSQTRTKAAVESAYLSLVLGCNELLKVKDNPNTRRVCANLFQDFEYSYYPAHAELRKRARLKVKELGGADIEPDGPPGFMRLKPLIGWKVSRYVQLGRDNLFRRNTPIDKTEVVAVLIAPTVISPHGLFPSAGPAKTDQVESLSESSLYLEVTTR